jgi:fused signal recognition particle receptor
MNNADNPNRVVINLDGDLDNLDDDDITLPSLPVQSVDIIDEAKSANTTPIEPTEATETASDKAANATQVGNIALGSPIVSPEADSETPNQSTDVAASDDKTDINNDSAEFDVSKVDVPKMPLQAQL